MAENSAPVGLSEEMVARFASDIVNALVHLRRLRIAHRDVRSDNLLLNSAGVVKLGDFSNAVQVTAEQPLCSDIVGVVYWQAPEMRSGLYDPLRVDIWSLGATVWELLEGVPPFFEGEDVEAEPVLADRWPALRNEMEYSDALRRFLQMCSETSAERVGADVLQETPFIARACAREEVSQFLELLRQAEQS